MRNAIILVLSICLFLMACEEDSPSYDSLESYVQATGRNLSTQLIACAAGGQDSILTDATEPVSIFFLPMQGIREIKYFETDSVGVNPDVFSNYRERNLPLEPVFNGFLRRFVRPRMDRERWCKVSFILEDSVHVSNAIRLKQLDKPTEFAPQLLEVDQATALSPRFDWQDGQVAENVIYFQVVSTVNGDVISATYTYDRFFQFYDVSNVVLNVGPMTPTPRLEAGTEYQISLMGVSLDNWVNLFAVENFVP